MRLVIFLAVLCCSKLHYGQQSTPITGQLMEMGSDTPISNAMLSLESTSQNL